jgi:hypothetical protein
MWRRGPPRQNPDHVVRGPFGGGGRDQWSDDQSAKVTFLILAVGLHSPGMHESAADLTGGAHRIDSAVA